MKSSFMDLTSVDASFKEYIYEITVSSICSTGARYNTEYEITSLAFVTCLELQQTVDKTDT